MLLRITDGTTTIILNDDAGTPTTGVLGARYFPRDPGAGQTVTETADVVCSGAPADIEAAFNAIEQLFVTATEQILRPNDATPRVYVEYAVRDGVDVYRSPVISGRVTWSENKRLRQVYGSSTTVEVAVVFERAAYWEGPETEAATGTISNGNGAPYNALSIAAPSGTLPAPITVTMDNASGLALTIRYLYLNVDAFVGATTNQHLINGSAQTWLANVDHNSLTFEVVIPDALIAKMAGASMQILASLSSVSGSDIYWKAALYTIQGGLKVKAAEGDERHMLVANDTLLDLGSIPIPATGRATMSTDLEIVVSVRSVSSGGATLDFIQLAPALNRLRLYHTMYDVASTASIVEDSANEVAYVSNSGQTYDYVRRSGGPLLIYPGRANRLHVLFNESSAVVPTRSLDLTVNYRPRRATI